MKKFFKKLLRVVLLAPAILLFGLDGDGGGGSDTGDKGGDKGGSDNGGGDKGSEGDKATVTMTQAEFDKTIQDRLKRGGKAAVDEFIKNLGVSKEQLETLVKNQKEAEDKEKSESQKQKERADKLENEKKSTIEAANAKLAKAAFLVQAVAVGIPADRIQDAAELVRTQLAALTPDEKTGEFVEADIKKIADDLVKEKPWLKGTSGSGDVGGGGGNGGGGGEMTPALFGENLAKERNTKSDSKSDPWKSQRL